MNLFIRITLMCLLAAPLFGRCAGKVDLGVAYIHIDVLESNKTIKRMDMPGIRGDATILICEGYGWSVKPSILYGNDGSGHGEVASAGIGFGHCTPITDRLTLTPSVGISYGYVKTKIKIPLMLFVVGEDKFTEKFRSISPYLSLDATYKFCDNWRICGMYQYAWSRTHTTIEGLLKNKSHAQGSNYALLLEYDLNSQWTFQIAGAYNISLSKEKHGIRAAGGKLGLAYWF